MTSHETPTVKVEQSVFLMVQSVRKYTGETIVNPI